MEGRQLVWLIMGWRWERHSVDWPPALTAEMMLSHIEISA